MSARTLWWADPEALGDSTKAAPTTPVVPADADTANLTSSLLENGSHSPVLDIDFEARLVPSSTPGHYHLYLDGAEMSWGAYRQLLEALAEAGIIQEGYLAHSINRGQTMVRLPHVKKEVDA